MSAPFERQTAAFSVAGFGGDGARPVAIVAGESESAPVPLTHRVPFPHDVRERGNGGRYGARVAEVHGGVQAEGGAALPREGRHLRRDRQGARVDPGSVSDWVKRADAAGSDPSANPFQVAEENRRLKRENERLRRENEILLKASAFFASRQL